MKRTTKRTSFAVGAAIVLALAPGSAFAATGQFAPAQLSIAAADAQTLASSSVTVQQGAGQNSEETTIQQRIQAAAGALVAEQKAVAARAETERTDKVLAYDEAAIAAIGTQESTGHTICCPSFSCAYADAVIDGTIHDHSYYTCSCCTWTDWGGGGSWDRCVGTDEELLREAYDQIAAGRPTVIHVTSGSGEHWIALIGYQGASDPDHLTLDNFIALDPWDGAQIVASERYSLYGDGCEHISER